MTTHATIPVKRRSFGRGGPSVGRPKLMPSLTLTGLDIGSTSIRAVEVSRSKYRPVIDNFGQVALPPGAVVAGVVTDDRAVTSALRQLWTVQKLKNKNVVLGITNQQVIVRELDVPNLSPRELKQALPYQVRDVLPIPIEQALLDFYPLETGGKSKGDSVHGLLIAAPKTAVLSAVHAVERAGLHVTKVDLASFAALRAAGNLGGDAEAIIDIGAFATNIVVHLDGAPQVVRTVPRGGAEITAMIASRMGSSVEEAETVKCLIGLEARADSETAEVVNEALRPLTGEIRSSLTYFRSSHPGRRIARMSLCGGGALLPGLTTALSRQLDLPVILADPLQRVRDSRRGGRHDQLERFRSSAAVSIGLTLGAA